MDAGSTHETSTKAKPVLTEDIYDREGFAHETSSGRIDLGHNNSTQGVIYQMAEKTGTLTPLGDGKSMGQTYYEEVEALVADGLKNADAVREVATKYGKKENAVRGGIFQYKKAHVNGGGGAATTSRRRRAPATADDYLARARTAVEAAIAATDNQLPAAEARVARAEEELAAAKAQYEELKASVAERKADLQKKLKALQ